MSSILTKLDGAPQWSDERWFLDLWTSLSQQPDGWVGAARSDVGLSIDRAWTLLGWMEQAATVVARDRSQSLVEAAAFARSLLTVSEIDLRDIAIVEALLCRGAHLGGVNFERAVHIGCARAGRLGMSARRSLLRAPCSTPATHAEEGEGRSFVFRRLPAPFDVEELERWLDGDST